MALAGMDSYASSGRSSIPPEQLLKAQLLRGNRQLVEQIHYNFLFHCFLGMSLDEKVWNHSSFSKNNDRLIVPMWLPCSSPASWTKLSASACCRRSISPPTVLSSRRGRPSRASSRKIRKMGLPQPAVARTARLTSKARNSATKPTALLQIPMRASTGRVRPKLCYQGHTLMENRSGLIVRTAVTQATGTAEREATNKMIQQLPRRQPGASPSAPTRGMTPGSL